MVTRKLSLSLQCVTVNRRENKQLKSRNEKTVNCLPAVTVHSVQPKLPVFLLRAIHLQTLMTVYPEMKNKRVRQLSFLSGAEHYITAKKVMNISLIS